MAAGIPCVKGQITFEGCTTGAEALQSAVLVSIARDPVIAVVVLGRVDAWTRRVHTPVIDAPVEGMGPPISAVAVHRALGLDVHIDSSACIGIAEDIVIRRRIGRVSHLNGIGPGDDGVISTPCERIVRAVREAIIRRRAHVSVSHDAALNVVVAAELDVAPRDLECEEEEWEYGKHSKHLSSSWLPVV